MKTRDKEFEKANKMKKENSGDNKKREKEKKLSSEWLLERRALVLPANGVSGSARGLTQFSELLVLLPQSLHRHVVEPRAAGNDGLQFLGEIGRLLHRHRHAGCHGDQPG